MTAVDFPESQVVFARNQPEYQPLPAAVTNEGVVISCWELTDEEIEELKKTKKLWLLQLTFGQQLQPQLPQVECPFERSEAGPVPSL